MGKLLTNLGLDAVLCAASTTWGQNEVLLMNSGLLHPPRNAEKAKLYNGIHERLGTRSGD